jgi:hypothetical protein
MTLLIKMTALFAIYFTFYVVSGLGFSDWESWYFIFCTIVFEKATEKLALTKNLKKCIIKYNNGDDMVSIR